MKDLFVDLMEDEAGLILSAEMVLILTIAVLGVIVGLAQIQTAIVTEFYDLSLAFSGMNQSYSTPAFFGCGKWWGRTSFTAGSGYIDFYDGCIGNGWSGGVGGFGGGGMAGGGFAEIGGGGYSRYSTSTGGTTVNTPSVAMPCETCPPGTETLTPTPSHDNVHPTPLAPTPIAPTPLTPPSPPTKD